MNGTNVGSLVGLSFSGTVRNCYAVGSLAESGDTPNADGYSMAIVSGGDQIGGLVGLNQGTISNCYAEASISAEVDDVGGLVGANSGTIDRCSASGSIAQGYAAGGLTGGNSGTITNSRASTSVLTGEPWVGGLVGSNIGTIKDCYATGDVMGSGCVGSLVGGNYSFSSRPNPATISNCYAVGSVSGRYDFGGLLGVNDGGVVEASFWDVEATGQSVSPGGFGKTPAQMRTRSTFANAGWDFDTPEQMNEIGRNAEDWARHFKLMADIDLAAYAGADFNINRIRW